MDNDTISRQAAIDAVKTYLGDYEISKTVQCRLRLLPSAQPERKKGVWIKLDMHAHIADHKCTACGEECYVPTCMGEPMYIYYPNCGAKMDTEEESDD